MKKFIGMLMIAFVALAINSFAGDPVKSDGIQKPSVVQIVVANTVEESTFILSEDHLMNSVDGIKIEVTAPKVTAEVIWMPEYKYVAETESGSSNYYVEYQWQPTFYGGAYMYVATGYCTSGSSGGGSRWACSQA